MSVKLEDRRTDHEKEIDLLIPIAAKMADQVAMNRDSWVREYMKNMNELTIEKGLRVPIEVILAAQK